MRAPARSAVLVGTALAAAALPAAAQTPQEVATRRALISRAQQLSDQRNHAGALDAAERAGRIQMTPSLRLFIAQEQEALGQFAEAFGSADLCVHEAQRDTSASNRAQIQRECQALSTQLQPRLGFVTVQPGAAPPAGLTVQVNRQPLGAALYGTPYAVTPGFVPVQASAPGYITYQTSVGVRAGQTLEVPLRLVRDPNAVVVAPPPAATPAPTVLVVRPRRFEAVHGVLLIGGGVVTLAGAAMGVVNLVMNSQFQSSFAPGDRASLQGTGDVMAWGADLGLGVGLAMAAVGLVLYLAQDTRERAPAAARNEAPRAPEGAGTGVPVLRF